MENYKMSIELIITIIIAIVGWIIAVIEMKKNRNWQRKDAIANRRYEAYSKYLAKIDEISGQMKKAPQEIIGKMQTEFLTSLFKDGNSDEALIRFNKQLAEYVSNSVEPMSIMKQEISSLKLVASPKMLVLLDELQALTDDLYNDFQNCLSKLNPSDTESFKALETVGKEKRYTRFITLDAEIKKLMREEIQFS